MVDLKEPCESNCFYAAHVSTMRNSLKRLAGLDLVSPELNDLDAARFLFDAPFALVSHNSDPDPLFNYANSKAMELFEMEWSEIIGLPSQMSAERANREERARLLEQVSKLGYIDDYCGIRISASGRCFRISDAVVWNLLNADDKPAGQAAMFSNWEFV